MWQSAARSRVVLLVLDGARPDVLELLLTRGDLPNIARHVVEPGSFRVGTTVFPSTTGAAYVPLLLGRYPGVAGVPGIRWLDRAGAAGSLGEQWRAARSYCGSQAGWIDDDITASPTMFELVDGYSICSPVNRGLRRDRNLMAGMRTLLGVPAHFFPGAYTALDDAVATTWKNTVERTWRFLFVVFPGIDGVSHLRDPFDASVFDRYLAADRALGAFVECWRTRGRGPLPDFFITSDHGMSAVASHCDVAEALEAADVATIRHPFHVWRRAARAAVMVSGNGAAHVYFDPRSGRRAPLTGSEIPAGLLDLLRGLPGVGMVAARDGAGGARVWTDHGVTDLRSVGGDIGIRHECGDALLLGGNAVLEDRALLASTLAGPFPDAPRQILQLLASPRSGDLVLAARDGFDLRARFEVPEHRAGHGSLLPAHMRVPILSSLPLPDVPIRTVDLFPTILSRLGIPLPDGLDGRPIDRLSRAFSTPRGEPWTS